MTLASAVECLDPGSGRIRTCIVHSNPGKIPGPQEKWSSEKWSPEKWSAGKMVPGKMVRGKNRARKIGPRETQKRKIVGLASSFVVCVECWDVINL